jgi:hypothetical protein
MTFDWMECNHLYGVVFLTVNNNTTANNSFAWPCMAVDWIPPAAINDLSCERKK